MHDKPRCTADKNMSIPGPIKIRNIPAVLAVYAQTDTSGSRYELAIKRCKIPGMHDIRPELPDKLIQAKVTCRIFARALLQVDDPHTRPAYTPGEIGIAGKANHVVTDIRR